MHSIIKGATASRVRIICIIFLVLAGGYLILDHGQHLSSILPFVLLFGCFFMHLFMHGSHGNHEKHSDAGREANEQKIEPNKS